MCKKIITTVMAAMTGFSVANAQQTEKSVNEKDENQMTEKKENAIVRSYKAIENGVVKGYKGIENGVVKGYKAIEDAFVDTFFTEDPRVSAESAEVNAKSVESAKIDE